jgi:hypothetical protein|tara:strand:- start:434 stop:778 length:345 start_codon:yes stop_codon:yes gene_type:complete
MTTLSEKQKEDWMNSKWRPAMGWMYMLICMTDFVIFPVLFALLQTMTKQPITQWDPITLRGAGLFHLAMGAIIGVTAFGRTQEKLGGATTPAPIHEPASAPVFSRPPPAQQPPL